MLESIPVFLGKQEDVTYMGRASREHLSNTQVGCWQAKEQR